MAEISKNSQDQWVVSQAVPVAELDFSVMGVSPLEVCPKGNETDDPVVAVPDPLLPRDQYNDQPLAVQCKHLGWYYPVDGEGPVAYCRKRGESLPDIASLDFDDPLVAEEFVYWEAAIACAYENGPFATAVQHVGGVAVAGPKAREVRVRLHATRPEG